MAERELKPLGVLTGGGGPGGPITSELITDASDVGKAVLTGNDVAAREAIGAGTSSLEVGTEPTDAKAGDWQPAVDDLTDAGAAGKAVAKAATQTDARAAIGAGTSSLALGSTASTAKAGNWKPAVDDLTDAGVTGKALAKTTSAAAAREALEVPGVADVEDLAAAAAEAAVPGELGSSAVVDPASTVAGLVTGRRAREAAVAALVAFGQPYTIYYNGSAWPALSTVPAAYIATGRPIVWDSMTYPAAPAPPEGRTGDFWDSVEEDA